MAVFALGPEGALESRLLAALCGVVLGLIVPTTFGWSEEAPPSPFSPEQQFQDAMAAAEAGELLAAEAGFEDLVARGRAEEDIPPRLRASALFALGEISLQRGRRAEAWERITETAETLLDLSTGDVESGVHPLEAVALLHQVAQGLQQAGERDEATRYAGESLRFVDRVLAAGHRPDSIGHVFVGVVVLRALILAVAEGAGAAELPGFLEFLGPRIPSVLAGLGNGRGGVEGLLSAARAVARALVHDQSPAMAVDGFAALALLSADRGDRAQWRADLDDLLWCWIHMGDRSMVQWTLAVLEQDSSEDESVSSGRWANRASLAAAQGELLYADALLGAAERQARQREDLGTAAALRSRRAQVAAAGAAPMSVSVSLYRSAARQFARIDRPGDAVTEESLAIELLREAGELRAVSKALSGLDTNWAEQSVGIDARARLILAQAQVAAASGDREGSRALLGDVGTLLFGQERAWDLGHLASLYGLLELQAGAWKEAEEAFEAATEFEAAVGLGPAAWRAQLGLTSLARIYGGSGGEEGKNGEVAVDLARASRAAVLWATSQDSDVLGRRRRAVGDRSRPLFPGTWALVFHASIRPGDEPDGIVDGLRMAQVREALAPYRPLMAREKEGGVFRHLAELRTSVGALCLRLRRCLFPGREDHPLEVRADLLEQLEAARAEEVIHLRQLEEEEPGWALLAGAGAERSPAPPPSGLHWLAFGGAGDQGWVEERTAETTRRQTHESWQAGLPQDLASWREALRTGRTPSATRIARLSRPLLSGAVDRRRTGDGEALLLSAPPSLQTLPLGELKLDGRMLLERGPVVRLASLQAHEVLVRREFEAEARLWAVGLRHGSAVGTAEAAAVLLREVAAYGPEPTPGRLGGPLPPILALEELSGDRRGSVILVEDGPALDTPPTALLLAGARAVLLRAGGEPLDVAYEDARQERLRSALAQGAGPMRAAVEAGYGAGWHPAGVAPDSMPNERWVYYGVPDPAVSPRTTAP